MTAGRHATEGHGTLFLVPVALGDTPWPGFLPAQAQAVAAGLNHFVVESARAARAHLKQLDYPHPLRDTDIRELPADAAKAHDAAFDALLAPALEGRDVGLMSDAGCPAVADPGARLVARAHARGIRVVPLVGPSSILLGLMGSGLNGQSFAFHGYLPVNEIERDKALRALEDESRKLGRTQIFIETPYRNERMFDALLKTLKPETRLCIACELNTASESILTRHLREWKQTQRPALAKRPCLFLLLG
ncbi:SAM-dependent methyltransferase [Thauera linaloolentis]|uniref:Uroporphyrin-III C/tetrapyrrole methyltransferase n=1 Tax=Thauera linaloolentis (strain DSM 12138 / JCM 21573 / CCUG 41526 / CIP 105981 / IAM 15112 / NBRC 102519 / 47Lol) TaxID=1123367 RepID=N6Z1S6_THAL4|nr:SAM-dependent methyltransferase [Thauera linaloolentis]ENO88557.1 uroporphyrin-III C/tetrapyrrole methyltransferase [Thauera linaloolentis 47Lol = DSM 12138]MCM8564865.1 SAM-dependent methyltransferase [Thauera linaloolentis]